MDSALVRLSLWVGSKDEIRMELGVAFDGLNMSDDGRGKLRPGFEGRNEQQLGATTH